MQRNNDTTLNIGCEIAPNFVTSLSRRFVTTL